VGGVPLVEPGEELGEAGEEGKEARGVPGVLGAALFVERGEGLGALEVVPAGPAEDGVGGVELAAGVADEALFGDVEFAAEAPGGGVAVVALVVFGGDGDGRMSGGELAGVFEALEGPGVLPLGVFLETGGAVAVGGEEGDGLGEEVGGSEVAAEGGGGQDGAVEAGLDQVEEAGSGVGGGRVDGEGPAALVFGLLDEKDLRREVELGESGGVGGWAGVAVAAVPGGWAIPPEELDFEGAVARGEGLGEGPAGLGGEKAKEAVDGEVEALLEGTSARADALALEGGEDIPGE
jgi:hypothetical protein